MNTDRNDAEDRMASAARNVGNLASQTSEQIEEGVSRAKAKLAEMQAVLADRTKECLRTTDEYVRENPWTVIGVAAGIGLVIGLLIRRR